MPSVRKHRLLKTTLLLILGLGLAALSAGAGTDSLKVVAYVNGEPIKIDVLERELVRIHTSNRVEMQRSGFSVDRLIQKLVCE